MFVLFSSLWFSHILLASSLLYLLDLTKLSMQNFVFYCPHFKFISRARCDGLNLPIPLFFLTFFFFGTRGRGCLFFGKLSKANITITSLLFFVRNRRTLGYGRWSTRYVLYVSCTVNSAGPRRRTNCQIDHITQLISICLKTFTYSVPS